MKIFGVVIWSVGVVCFAAALYISCFNGTAPKTIAIVALIGALYAVTLLYSWLWSSNRGHIAYLTQIAFLAILGIGYLAAVTDFVSVKIFVWLGLILVAAMVTFIYRFGPEIYRNYFNNRR